MTKESLIKLRNYFLGFSAGLLAVTVIVVAITTFAAQRTTQLAEQMYKSLQRTEIAKDLEYNLSSHKREYYFFTSTGKTEHAERFENTRVQIEKNLISLRALAESTSELSLIKSAETLVGEYKLIHKTLREDNSTPYSVYDDATRSYDRAREAIDKVVAANDLYTAKLEERVADYDWLASTVGLASIPLTLFLLIAIFWSGRKNIYFPLVNLSKALEKYDGLSLSLSPSEGKISEIHKIRSSFQQMHERLLQAKEQRLHFMSSVAHDLKNPLWTIRMAVSEISEELSSYSQDQKELLEIVERQAIHLERLVADLSASSRLESSSFENLKKPVDIRELVKDAAKIYDVASSKHNVTFTAPAAPVICNCDPDRIRQVINNLISNAIKYSPAGGNVNVSVEVMSSYQVAIRINDEGMGLKPENLEQIFQPYFRANDQLTQTIPGEGLGLATCKKIIQHHGGTIGVVSEFGKGSTFTVILPMISLQPSATQTI